MWIADDMSKKTKVSLYQSFVQSLLMYNTDNMNAERGAQAETEGV